MLKNENKKVVHFTSNGMTPFSPLHIKDAINAIKSEIENYNRKNFVTKNIGAPLINTKKFVALYKEIRKKLLLKNMMLIRNLINIVKLSSQIMT